MKQPEATALATTEKSGSRQAGYSSPSIIARRQRILDETLKLIGETGLSDLSLDDVAQRANVAKRTIYNAFQSKEHLVATVISRLFANFATQVEYVHAVDTLDGMIERLIRGARRNKKMRNFMRALMNIYFSTDLDPEMRQVVRQVAGGAHEAWVKTISQKGDLQPWADEETLIDMLISLRYAAVHAWLEKIMKDDYLEKNVTVGYLKVLAGATRGETHAEIMGALENIDAKMESFEKLPLAELSPILLEAEALQSKR